MPRKLQAKSNRALQVLAVVGSLGEDSVTRLMMREVCGQLRERKCEVDLLDFRKEPLPLFNPDTAFAAPGFAALQERVTRADVLVLGSPDYHGSMSSAAEEFPRSFLEGICRQTFCHGRRVPRKGADGERPTAHGGAAMQRLDAPVRGVGPLGGIGEGRENRGRGAAPPSADVDAGCGGLWGAAGTATKGGSDGDGGGVFGENEKCKMINYE